MKTTTTPANRTKPRGFALMSEERRSQIASMGGIAAHKLGTAHEWTREEAQIAGRKGGAFRHPNKGRRRNLIVGFKEEL